MHQILMTTTISALVRSGHKSVIQLAYPHSAETGQNPLYQIILSVTSPRWNKLHSCSDRLHGKRVPRVESPSWTVLFTGTVLFLDITSRKITHAQVTTNPVIKTASHQREVFEESSQRLVRKQTPSFAGVEYEKLINWSHWEIFG